MWEIGITGNGDDERCQFCGGIYRLVTDHIIPKSKGGRLTPGNIQWLCVTCNSKKNNRTNDEFLLRLCEVKLRPEYEAALQLAIGAEATRLIADYGGAVGAIRRMYDEGHVPGKPIEVSR